MNVLLILKPMAKEQTRLRNIFYASPLAVLPVANKPLVLHYYDFFHFLKIKKVRIVSEGSGGALRKLFHGNSYASAHTSFSLASSKDTLSQIIQKNMGFLKEDETIFFYGYAFLFFQNCLSKVCQENISKLGNFHRQGNFCFGRIKKVSNSLVQRYEDLEKKSSSSHAAKTLSKKTLKNIPFSLYPLETLSQYHKLSKELLIKNKAGTFPGFCNDEGIHTGRNLVMRPKVKIQGPVAMGDFVVLEKYAHVGPHAVIGDRVYIDEHSSVENSIIFGDSYIGKWLAIKNSVLYKQRLYSLEKETYVDILDEAWYKNLSDSGSKRHVSSYIFGFMFACMLLALQYPFYLLYKVFSVSVLSVERKRIAVYISDSLQVSEYWEYHFEDEKQLSRKIFKLLLLDKRQALKDCMRGRLSTGGNSILLVSAATRSAIKAMPQYRPAVFGYSEAFGASHEPADAEQKIFDDLYFASAHSLLKEIKIILAALVRRICMFL